MSESQRILLDATTRFFAEHFPEDVVRSAVNGHWLRDSWEAAVAFGLPLALVDESYGGFGLDTVETLELIRLAGRFVVPLPIAESMLANLLLTRAHLQPAVGVVTIASATTDSTLRIIREGSGWKLFGAVARVPWGRHADTVVTSARTESGLVVARVDKGGWSVEPGCNLAGMPRDSLTFDVTLAPEALGTTEPHGLTPLCAGAAARVMQMAGAIERVLEMTTAYVQERVQFGRELAKFQAVQQEVARLAGQVAAAGAAADLCADAVAANTPGLALPAAKVRCAEAAGVAAAIAHQLHGATGFADEHALSLLTKSLWSWRDEFGSQAYWSRIVGDAVFDVGSHGAWPLLTAV